MIQKIKRILAILLVVSFVVTLTATAVSAAPPPDYTQPTTLQPDYTQPTTPPPIVTPPADAPPFIKP